MFFAYSRDNAIPYYNLLEILTLENIYKFKVALFTHKITNNVTNVPMIFKGTLTLASEVHRYNTRFTTFAFVGSKMWENIPSKFKKTPIITSISIINCTF